MKVKFKKLTKHATAPHRGSEYAAGWDLVATSFSHEKGIISYGTSLAIEIPEGHFGILAARSSVYRTDLMLANSIGIIDSDYRGELIFKFRLLNQGDSPKVYTVGDRIGQLIILSHGAPEWAEVEVLSEAKRGKGGFGSTGK